MDSHQPMNKLPKVTIAILGGIETVFSILLPTIVALMWIRYDATVGISAKILIAAGIVSTIFRAIKIGWLVK